MSEPRRLSHTLQSRHVAMISLGGIIGAGLFVGSSAAIASIGPAVIVCYVLAGILILFTMRMLGELAVANPGIGFFTDYARKVLGHPFGFVGGWLYWYFWMIVVAVEAIAGAIIIAQWIAAPVWLIGLVLLVCLTGVNLMSARSYGEFEFWFSSIKVAAIIAFILITGSYVLGLTPGHGTDFSALTAFGGFAPHGIVSVLAGVVTVIFSLTGAEITTVAAAESKEPAKAIASMSTTLTVRVVLFYVLSIFFIVAAVNWTTIKSGQSPFIAALNLIGIPGSAMAMNIIVLTAVLSCLNSGIYVTSRALFALAAHGDAPKSLTVLNSRNVPARAILVGTVFGYAAMIASVVSPTVVFTFLVNASGTAMLFLYGMIGIAQIRYRSGLSAEAGARLQLKMWLFPALSYFTVVGIMAVLIAVGMIPDLRSQLTATTGFMVFLFAFYFLFRRGRYVAAEASQA
ncbi:MAG: amino acid permease [Alphaproteobacteria bacterium]|nr:amino acid permease [Alphaproteobacteria bacterium]